MGARTPPAIRVQNFTPQAQRTRSRRLRRGRPRRVWLARPQQHQRPEQQPCPRRWTQVDRVLVDQMCRLRARPNPQRGHHLMQHQVMVRGHPEVEQDRRMPNHPRPHRVVHQVADNFRHFSCHCRANTTIPCSRHLPQGSTGRRVAVR